MKNQICQSCGMPIVADHQLGKNDDGSVNHDYCRYCYDRGQFIHNVEMSEFVDMCSQFGEQAGMTNAQMKKYCTKLFPTLKRWKTS